MDEYGEEDEVEYIGLQGGEDWKMKTERVEKEMAEEMAVGFDEERAGVGRGE